MAPQRKRENRANNFYNVGVQGRKTGITLADKGVYDEHGLEPISGIFSSPEKSPPKRGSTNTASESMDIQESSIPELTTAHTILRSARTQFPLPRSRSPKKTMLGSSPRRQSSMQPRHSSVFSSSPAQQVTRRLEFDQDESNMQQTPVVNGSKLRRGKRLSVYDIPEENSPVYQFDAVAEESYLQAEIAQNENSVLEPEEESFVTQVGRDDSMSKDIEHSHDIEFSVVEQKKVKTLPNKGRKRKSDAIDSAQEAETTVTKTRRRGAVSPPISAARKKGLKKDLAPEKPARRSLRVSGAAEMGSSTLDVSNDTAMDNTEDAEQVAAPPKNRGRPSRALLGSGKENAMTTRPAKNVPVKTMPEPTFKKPTASTTKTNNGPRGRGKSSTKDKDVRRPDAAERVGKITDVHGNPLSKADIDQMSTASVGTRYGRGRTLSVFRELNPGDVAARTRAGRHRVAPLQFWMNDQINYDVDGTMTSIRKNDDPEPERRSTKGAKSKGLGRKKLQTIDEDEVELEPWEEEDEPLKGYYRDFDPATDQTLEDVVEDPIAWAEKNVNPVDVPDGSFQYTKLFSVDSFFNWGIIDLKVDQMKRTKNSRKMHMVFNVQSGTVEVKVHENEFIVHPKGVWQVPRGNTYSIRNVGRTTARVFFAQAMQPFLEEYE